MKRIYSLLLLLSISILNLSADQGHLTWSIVGFNPTDWAGGKKTLVVSDDKSGKEYKVNVTFGRFQFNTRSQMCTVLGKEYANIPYISMYDAENGITSPNVNKIAYSSYILFEPVGDYYIKKIEFLGYSRESSNSFLTLGASSKGSVPTGNNTTCPYNNFNDNDPIYDDSYQQLTFPSALPAPEVCTTQGNWIGSGQDQNDGEEQDVFQKGIKFLRLNWSGAVFAGGHTPDRGGSLELLGFQIYTNLEGLGTSIESENEDSFAIEQKGETLVFSSLADVKIYSLSGQVVVSAVAVDEVSMESLQQGVYIVQAKDVATGKVVSKKVIK